MRNSFLSRLAGAANGAMCLLVALYGAFVLVLQCEDTFFLPIFSIGLFALCLPLSRKAKCLDPKAQAPGNSDRRVFFAAAGFSLFVSLTYLFAYFPGGFSTDTTTQWHQLRGELPLSDWHPALHTMLLWLLTRVAEHPAFVLLVQGAAYACAVGYAASAMHRHHLPKMAVGLTTLYLSANPAISNLMVFPWKDCAFAIAALFLFVQLFEIHLSQGEWLCKKKNLFFFALALVLSAILRHNGIALSLAAAVWLLVSLPGARKRGALAAVLFAALFALIKGPLYGAAGVEKNATPLDETIGLPMTVLSHVYVRAPQSLDTQTVAFLETMGPHEVYAEHHRCGDWNETKWFVSSLPENHGYSFAQVFGFTFKAVLAEPALALEALAGLFDMPMLLTGEAYWRMSPYTDLSAAQFGFEAAHQPFLTRALNWLCRQSASPALAWLCWRPGVWLLMVMVFCVLFARRRPLSSLLLPAAIIGYHLATTLVLSSPTDMRFYLPTLMGAPLAAAALFLRPKND